MLTSIIFGDNVTAIINSAFLDCSNLANIVIGKNVKSIGAWAFKNCNNLTSVYYKGSAGEWNTISISTSYNDILWTATRYYYKENEPALNLDGTAYEGNYWRYVDGVATPWVYKE